MNILKESRLMSLIRDESSIKIISAADRNGAVHSAVKQSLHVDDDGNLRYFELLEHSETGKALTYSLWFERQVSVLIVKLSDPGPGQSFEIRGTPIRALITGKEFEAAYRSVRGAFGEKADLSAILVIRPDEIRDPGYEIQRERHDAMHPFAVHLDRLVREQSAMGVTR
jgi:hypothetical protein